MRRVLFLAALAILGASSPSARAVPNTTDTCLLQSPAVSKDHIAFVYAGDVWVCDLEGKHVRRLTSDLPAEANPAPVFSPDGRTLAYTGRHEGGRDVYRIPVAGGIPTRLTWRPNVDRVCAWTPDGKAVVFTRGQADNFFAFAVPTGGGFPTPLRVPHATDLCFSADGSQVAYTPWWDASRQWKHYRGGTASRILIMRLKDLTVEQVPQPAGRCNDTHPCWLNDTVYFRSDRNGEFNVFAYDTKSKTVRQLTRFEDFPVLSLKAGGGNLVFEQAGYIHRLDPHSGHSHRLKIGVAADLPHRRPDFVKAQGMKQIRHWDISPTGERAVLEFRGEIVTMRAGSRDTQDLTNTPGVHERSPVWSPDGKAIAYFSDEGGEYALHVRPADGKRSARVYKLHGAGFYEDPVWSPDSRKIAFVDNAWTLYWLDLASGKVKKVAAEPLLGPTERRSLRAAWAPDSNWIAYALNNRSAYRVVYIYSLETDRSYAITNGMSDATEPAFDASGKYLYFFASTNAGPVNAWFNLSSVETRATRRLYLALLQKGTPAPFNPKDDSHIADSEQRKGPVTIDLDGLSQRVVQFPVPAGDYEHLGAGKPGEVFYLSQPPTLPDDADAVHATLTRYTLQTQKSERLASEITSYRLSADKKKALVHTDKDTLSIIALSPGADVAGGELKLGAVEVRVDPDAEWRQIFDEAWRMNRDYFYDPHMHGADWPAMKKKYAVFLPHLTSSADLYRVIRWMLSELSVSHSRAFSPEEIALGKTTSGGFLGADYEMAQGRYRFQKVYDGVTWWPDVRAPLAAPGARVKAGEYLLAVRGVPLTASGNLDAMLEHTAGKRVEITVGPHADGSGARTVTIVPLASDNELRKIAWVESNRQKVWKATNGRVAYVYLPDTGETGHAWFKRYFYAQLDKEAVILDERFNHGGHWADYYLEHLRRPFSSYWALRYGADFRSPSVAILGPKVMLINEAAGSGGDGLAWMFRQSKLGLLIGKRTWGGEAGTLGYPEMMDGGMVTAPNFTLWSPEGGWVVENEGVAPDIEVEPSAADILAGRDTQLDKAIEVVLKQMRKAPLPPPRRPPYPVRVRKASAGG